MNIIILSNARLGILDHNAFKSYKFCFQIENDNRKYVLCTKSAEDRDMWVLAIQGQIELSKDNKFVGEVNTFILQKEKDIAHRDMNLIRKIFNTKNIIYNPVQPILLAFVNDHFICELLPHLTQYMSLASEREYRRQALAKA